MICSVYLSAYSFSSACSQASTLLSQAPDEAGSRSNSINLVHHDRTRHETSRVLRRSARELGSSRVLMKLANWALRQPASRMVLRECLICVCKWRRANPSVQNFQRAPTQNAASIRRAPHKFATHNLQLISSHLGARRHGNCGGGGGGRVRNSSCISRRRYPVPIRARCREPQPGIRTRVPGRFYASGRGQCTEERALWSVCLLILVAPADAPC